MHPARHVFCVGCAERAPKKHGCPRHCMRRNFVARGGCSLPCCCLFRPFFFALLPKDQHAFSLLSCSSLVPNKKGTQYKLRNMHFSLPALVTIRCYRDATCPLAMLTSLLSTYTRCVAALPTCCPSCFSPSSRYLLGPRTSRKTAGLVIWRVPEPGFPYTSMAHAGQGSLLQRPSGA